MPRFRQRLAGLYPYDSSSQAVPDTVACPGTAPTTTHTWLLMFAFGYGGINTEQGTFWFANSFTMRDSKAYETYYVRCVWIWRYRIDVGYPFEPWFHGRSWDGITSVVCNCKDHETCYCKSLFDSSCQCSNCFENCKHTQQNHKRKQIEGEELTG